MPLGRRSASILSLKNACTSLTQSFHAGYSPLKEALSSPDEQPGSTSLDSSAITSSRRPSAGRQPSRSRILPRARHRSIHEERIQQSFDESCLENIAPTTVSDSPSTASSKEGPQKGEPHELCVSLTFRGSFEKTTPAALYRCHVYKRDAAAGAVPGSWLRLGTTDHLEIPANSSVTQAFTKSLEIGHLYDDDTTVKLEIYRTPLERRRDSQSHTRREKIENAVVRWRQHATETTPRWSLVGTFICDLNGLVHRGCASGPLSSAKSGEDDASIELNAFAERSECDVAWRREDLIRFGVLQPTKLIISRQVKLKRSQAFAPFFRSAPIPNGQLAFVLNSSIFSDVSASASRMMRLSLVDSYSEHVIAESDATIASLLWGSGEHKMRVRPGFEACPTSSRSSSKDGLLPVRVRLEFEHPTQKTSRSNLLQLGNRKHRYSSSNSQCASSTASEESSGYSSCRNSVLSSRSEADEDAAAALHAPLSARLSSDGSTRVTAVPLLDDKQAIVVEGKTQAYLLSLVAPAKRIILRDPLTGMLRNYEAH